MVSCTSQPAAFAFLLLSRCHLKAFLSRLPERALAETLRNYRRVGNIWCFRVIFPIICIAVNHAVCRITKGDLFQSLSHRNLLWLPDLSTETLTQVSSEAALLYLLNKDRVLMPGRLRQVSGNNNLTSPTSHFKEPLVCCVSIF